MYPLGAIAKSSLLPAPGAWKWGSLVPSSLSPIPSGSVPSPSRSWFQCSAPSPAHSPSGTLPSTSPGQGRCLQLFCMAGEDIKGTKPLPRPCPASAPLPLSQFASWKMMFTGCSRGCWLSSTCPGPAEKRTRVPLLSWEGAFVPSLPWSCISSPLPEELQLLRKHQGKPAEETAAFPSFLLIHQPEPIKLTGAQLFPPSLLISDPLVRGDMIKCKIKCLMPGIWDYQGQAGRLEVEGCVWLQGGIGLVVLLHILSLICGIERAGKCESPARVQPRAVPKGKASLHDAREWLWEGISVQGWGVRSKIPPWQQHGDVWGQVPWVCR